MKQIVVDASVAAAWVLPNEQSGAASDLYAQACVDEGLFTAPQLWVWETGNLLISGVLRKRIAAQHVETAQQILADTLIEFDQTPTTHLLAQTSRLALKHKLTFFDASYLELVLRLNGQLASMDQALVKAAKACGVVCLHF